MGFAFRVAKGFRIAVTPRGIRAGIGPRFARVHVGSGPVGISTGVGPFTTWTSLNPGPRSPGRSADYDVAVAEHDALLTIHRERFAPAERPVLPPAQRADKASIEERTYTVYREEARATHWWKFAERKRIHRAAREAVLAQVEKEYEALVAEVAKDQVLADTWWDALRAGQPDVVIDALNDAFHDNVQEAVCVAFESGEASVVLAMPELDDVPERYPALTPTGRPTTKAYSKTDRNALHLHLVLAHVAVTLREAFAVAPSAERIRLVVVEGANQIVLAGVFDRSVTAHLDDDTAPLNLLDLGQDIVMHQAGRTRQLQAIDLRDEPDLAELAAMLVDTDVLS